MNALMMAASMGFPTVVRRLLEEDADYTAKNKVTRSGVVRDFINV